MPNFENKSESIFREIRKVIVYPASAFTYLNNLQGIFPQASEMLCSFNVIPENFAYKLATKTQNKNYLYELESNFPLLDLSYNTIQFCFSNFNREDFVVVFETNTEQIIFGNDREQLKIEIINNEKLNNSGDDEFTIVISGKSIIYPKRQLL